MITPPTDEEFEKLYESAEEAEKLNLEGASAYVTDFSILFKRQLVNYVNALYYNQYLNQIEIDGKTIHLTFKDVATVKGALLIWKLVPYPHKPKKGRSNWEYKTYLEISPEGKVQKNYINYKFIKKGLAPTTPIADSVSHP